MLIQVITLRYSSTLGGFDQTELQEFVRDKEVLSIRDHFFQHSDVPHLVFVVTYRLADSSTVATATQAKMQRDDAWKKALTDGDMPLFQTLRDWRSKRCKQDGVPPYVICNNLQLAMVAKTRPQTLAGLAKVEGFGTAKVEKYGKEILAILPSGAEGKPVDQPQTKENNRAKPVDG